MPKNLKSGQFVTYRGNVRADGVDHGRQEFLAVVCGQDPRMPWGHTLAAYCPKHGDLMIAYIHDDAVTLTDETNPALLYDAKRMCAEIVDTCKAIPPLLRELAAALGKYPRGDAIDPGFIEGIVLDEKPVVPDFLPPDF